jgi:hypothetical protein
MQHSTLPATPAHVYGESYNLLKGRTTDSEKVWPSGPSTTHPSFPCQSILGSQCRFLIGTPWMKLQ